MVPMLVPRCCHKCQDGEIQVCSCLPGTLYLLLILKAVCWPYAFVDIFWSLIFPLIWLSCAADPCQTTAIKRHSGQLSKLRTCRTPDISLNNPTAFFMNHDTYKVRYINPQALKDSKTPGLQKASKELVLTAIDCAQSFECVSHSGGPSMTLRNVNCRIKLKAYWSHGM